MVCVVRCCMLLHGLSVLCVVYVVSVACIVRVLCVLSLF